MGGGVRWVCGRSKKTTEKRGREGGEQGEHRGTVADCGS